MRRLSLCGMNAVTPSGLIVSDLDSQAMIQISKELDPSMIELVSNDQLSKDKIETIESKYKANLFLDSPHQSIAVYLPGVDKTELVIKQSGTTIFLFYLGQKRVIELPISLNTLTCQRGQINLGWLTLRFIQPEQNA